MQDDRHGIAALTRRRFTGSDDRLRPLLVAASVGLVGFAVRIGGALDFAFWQDEVGSAQAMLEHTPLDVALYVARFESTPPAFYVVGWAVHSLGVPLEEGVEPLFLGHEPLDEGVDLHAALSRRRDRDEDVAWM